MYLHVINHICNPSSVLHYLKQMLVVHRYHFTQKAYGQIGKTNERQQKSRTYYVCTVMINA